MIPQSAISLPRGALSRHQKIAFAILTAAFFLYWRQPTLAMLGLGVMLALPPLLYLVFRLADGNAEPIMLLWAGVCPLGYYFLSSRFVTFDGLVVFALAAGIVLCPKSRVTPMPPMLRYCGWAWFAFLVGALLSMVSVDQLSNPLHIWVLAFLMPAIVGWYVIACFPVRSHLRTLHGIICVVAIYSAAIGAAEMYLGRDLLPISAGGSDYFAGAPGGVWIMRANGPYAAQHSFGLIGLATFCLLGFLRQAMGEKVPRWQKVLHGLGITAALLQAMMPLTRSIFITIIVILLLDLFRKMSKFQKALRVGILATGGIAVMVVMMAVPELFEERVSGTENIYFRIAQQQQNLRLFMDYPVLGVGLTNFYKVASSKPTYSVSYSGVESGDIPHSNPGSVLTETGLVGFLPYFLSQCLLVAAFWKRRGSVGGKLAWPFFVYVFLSYWITGLSIASAYYSDLNLWYLFCFAVIYKYVITE